MFIQKHHLLAAEEKRQDLDQIGLFEVAIDAISEQLLQARNNNTQQVLQVLLPIC